MKTIYQVLNETGNPASREGNDEAIFLDHERAQAHIKYLHDECGLIDMKFKIITLFSELDIYMIPIEMVHDDFGEKTNGFLPSDWNDLDELPKEVLMYLQFCKDADLVYNPYNFMLDFNLENKETSAEDYLMFIPDEKFNL